MPTPNETITAAAGLGTVLVALYAAYTGAKGKGKDAALAANNASYDNIQEDLRESRAEEARLRDQLRAIERERDEIYTRLMRRQARLHDLYTLFRTLFSRLHEARLLDPHKDIVERVATIQNEPL